MFVHLGGEKVIRSSEIIAIFDMTIDQAKISKQFLNQSVKLNKSEVIGDEEPKSLVVTDSRIYYSPISSATLKKRAYHMTQNES